MWTQFLNWVKTAMKKFDDYEADLCRCDQESIPPYLLN